ncbi:TonB-dependent siderophore receptor [Methylocapsa palsarum]|uniref:Iron complex outermembrane recepter protein n=1 Tax=Methylocapsa palsarum TaxID=1612308 RepID=A0A1I3W7A3_9HYPH|nr:TonB-dependent siderophore receptor [Methylocapsa palsarum]SFK03468.1 iron complex outermembrane recepter protein [Methylocapsa palsarum]
MRYKVNRGRVRLTASIVGAALATLAPAAGQETTSAQAASQASQSAPESGADGTLVLDAVVATAPGGDGAASQSRPAVEGYVANSTYVGTKTDTPIIEVPQSVSVVTREQLDDRNVQTLSEALAYTPGVEIGVFGFDPRFDSFYVRGFDMTYTGIYRDGLRQPASPFAIYKTEPYGLDSITVLRGPSSALYGLGSPGGLIDMTSKRPTATTFHELQFQTGSYQRAQGQFDLGGPIDPAGVFSYRLTGLFRDSDTQLPGVKDNRDFIAPAFTWRPDAATSLTLLGGYMNSLTTGNPGFYQTPEGELTHIYSGDPAFGDFNQNQFRIGYAFEHKFDDTFTVRQNARYSYVSADAKYTQIDYVDFATLIANRSTGRVIDHLGTFGVDTQLLTRFSTGPIDHLVLTGVDYTYAQYNDKVGFGSAPDLYLFPAQPAYGSQFILSPEYSYNVDQLQGAIGGYIQDQAKFGPLTLTVSGRNDWVSTKTNDRFALTETIQNDQAFTGRVGLTYLSPIGLAPYANYATSFVPTIGTDAAGAPFRPITGDQKEVGVKYQPPGMNGLISAALFDITQYNSLSQDPANIAFQIQTGEVRSRGFELEGVVNPLPGLNVTLAYTALQQRIIVGDLDTVGNAPSGIPAQSFSIWGDYTLPTDAVLPGLGAGFGMRYIGASYGNDQNTFMNQPVTLFDAALHYDFSALDTRLSGLRFQLNATNLFNKQYSTSQAGFGYWGQDRTVIASLRYRW